MDEKELKESRENTHAHSERRETLSLHHHLPGEDVPDETLALGDLGDRVVAHARLADVTADDDGGGRTSQVARLVEVGDVQLDRRVVVRTNKVRRVAALARDVELDVDALCVFHDGDRLFLKKKNTNKKSEQKRHKNKNKKNRNLSFEKKLLLSKRKDKRKTKKPNVNSNNSI